MRIDLEKSFDQGHIDPAKLSPFQKILLTTDGTVTDILEAYCSEPMQVVKLSEELVEIDSDIPALELERHAKVIKRNIFLRGRISHKNHIYAESILSFDRLESNFQNELLKTKTPIGKIWLEQRIETFKEIIHSGREAAGPLAQSFNLKPEDTLLFRTYCVFCDRRPTMMITEKFPESHFLNHL